MKTQQKFKAATLLASSALLLNTLSTAAFAVDNITIEANGSHSDNNFTQSSNSNILSVQSNDATIHNDIESHVTTGGNNITDGTNGNAAIGTGNALSNVTVSTVANSNRLVAGGDYYPGDVNATIKGNGTEADTNITLDSNSNISSFQDNSAHVHNEVESNPKTGNNGMFGNTGGDQTIVTGHATANTAVSTTVNANVLDTNYGHRFDNQGGTLNVSIKENGSGSKNNFTVSDNQDVSSVQNNNARIYNDVDTDPKTGRNFVTDSTGGDVRIDTGHATANTTIDNRANFNAAILDSSWLESVNASVVGNGSQSKNDISRTKTSNLSIFQDGNRLFLENEVETNPLTGRNDAFGNTGPVLFDPTVIVTGHATANTTVSNTANKNVFTNRDITLPGGYSLGLHFDLGSLFGSI